MWKLNNILLNKQWVKEEIKREILKSLKTNENENTTYQNKVSLSGKFIGINACINKKEDLQKKINFILQRTRKKEQTKPKISRRKEITKNRDK